jgi:hypothetical protein
LQSSCRISEPRSALTKRGEHGLEIQNQIATMLNAVDALDWSTVRAAFAPTVVVDYTSLFGGNAEGLAIDTLL